MDQPNSRYDGLGQQALRWIVGDIDRRLTALEQERQHQTGSTSSSSPNLIPAQYQRLVVLGLLVAIATGVIKPEVGLKLLAAMAGLGVS